MASIIRRCVVVEIPDSAEGHDAQPRDLLPWADPYIARLLSRHRLRSALDDSLRFVEDQVDRFRDHDSQRPPRLPSNQGLDNQWDSGGSEWRFD